MTARLSDEAPHYPHDPGTPDAEIAAMRLALYCAIPASREESTHDAR